MGALSTRRDAGQRMRWHAALVGGLVFALTLTAFIAVPASAATAHSKPGDGPYAVGKRSVTFVDTSRPTAANGSYAGAQSRTLPVMILYPTAGDAASTVDTPDAAPLAGHRFPLVVFSHGFTATGPAYEYLLREWAAAGYVIAAPTFPLSNAGAPGGAIVGDYVNQPADVSFVITQMIGLGHTKGDPLFHLIARRRIAVAGHSLGAITTLGVAYNSCCQDPRIDAAVPLSGVELGFPNGSYDVTGLATPAAPLLLVHGDADSTVPYSGSQRAFAREPAPKFLVTLIGAPHVPFGPPWITPIVRSVTDFLDRYLKQEPGAQAALNADAQVPGVATLLADASRKG